MGSGTLLATSGFNRAWPGGVSRLLNHHVHFVTPAPSTPAQDLLSETMQPPDNAGADPKEGVGDAKGLKGFKGP